MMAKYTSTSIGFFMALNWRAGMQYYLDVVEMSQEENEAMQSQQPKGVPQGLDGVRGRY